MGSKELLFRIMAVHDISKSPFFRELVEELRTVRLDALPEVVATLRRARGVDSTSRGTQPWKAPDELARKVLELPVEGSKLDVIQRAVVQHAVATTGGNVSAAARLLGMDRKALERKLARYARGEADDD